MTEENHGKLTYKRYLFCMEYMKDYNASRSARDAGYSPDTAHVQGSQLLAMPVIKETIEKLEENRLAAIQLSAEQILRSIAEIAEANKEFNPAIALRAYELLGRNKLWEKSGRGVNRIESNPDGTMRIVFDDGCEIKDGPANKDNPKP